MSAPPLFRLVDERRVSVVRDAAAVRRVLDEDPVGSCMVASRVAEHGVEPSAIGGELWTRRRASESLCYAGANLIPLRGDLHDLNAFADKAMSTARRCSSLVGRAEFVMPMWRRLEHAWGPARDVREHQPLMALSTAPQSPIDPAVRPVRIDELDAYLVAAIDMFIGEVGVDPRIGDGGRGYRRRVAGLIAAGRAWARFERGQVVFKAEVGSQSPSVGQIQGVWVHPDWRGRGLALRAPRRLRRLWCAAAASRASTSTTSTPSPAPRTRASVSLRSVHSRPSFSTDFPAARRLLITLQRMTDHDRRVARREIADALVRALERRHEVLDVIVEAEDYDAAIESIATTLGTSLVAAEAVLRLSFDRLTKVSRRRIAEELEDLNTQLSFTMGEQPASTGQNLVLRPFAADKDRDIFAARTDDVRAAGDGSGRPPVTSTTRFAPPSAESTPKRRHGWWPSTDRKVGMVFGELAGGEVNVRIWIHPAYRKRGYGTAVLRKSRSEMAAYFPAVPLVVRAPAAGP